MIGCGGTSSPTDASVTDASATDITASDVTATDVTATDVTASDVTASDASASDATATDVTADGPAPDVIAQDVVQTDAGPADAGGACTIARALITTSDFSTGGYALANLGEMPTLSAAGGMAPDQDHVPVQSECVVYNLLRGNDIVAVLDNANLPAIARRVPLRAQLADGGTGPYQVNPYDALTVSPTKAYVVQFGLPQVAVFNPSVDGAMALGARIDLTPLRHPSDTDVSGSPEPVRIARIGGRAFVALQNLSSFAPVANGTLAVIDVATDALVDVDSATAGTQGISLSAMNPVALSVTPTGSRLVVASAGVLAFTAPQVLDGAIEAIDANSLQRSGMRITEATLGGDLGDLVMLDDDRGWAVVTRLGVDGGAGDARVVAFNLATGTVGATITTLGAIGAMARDPRGDVWVLDRSVGAHGVRVFAPDGTPRGALLPTALPPYGLAFVP